MEQPQFDLTDGDTRQIPSSSSSHVVSQLSSCRGPAPFSGDPAALAIKKACDYSVKISMETARAGLAPRPVRVYADGVYDVFHSGHARQLMQAKCTLPNAYLIVGVSSDADVHKLKGRTVMNDGERYEAIRHCRYADEVLKNAPWSVDEKFLEEHKIDFVAHDDIPYTSHDSEDVYKLIKEKGMFLTTQRSEGISTTDVIGRIVRDYDVYLRRNLKRGLSRQELNISYVTEQRLKLKDNIEDMLRHGSSLIQQIGSKKREVVDHLEEISREAFRSFMHIFGNDGRLRSWLALNWNDGSSQGSSHSPQPSLDDNESNNDLDLYSSANSTNNNSCASDSEEFHKRGPKLRSLRSAKYPTGSSSGDSGVQVKTLNASGKRSLIPRRALHHSAPSGIADSSFFKEPDNDPPLSPVLKRSRSRRHSGNNNQ